MRLPTPTIQRKLLLLLLAVGMLSALTSALIVHWETTHALSNSLGPLVVSQAELTAADLDAEIIRHANALAALDGLAAAPDAEPHEFEHGFVGDPRDDDALASAGLPRAIATCLRAGVDRDTSVAVAVCGDSATDRWLLFARPGGRAGSVVCGAVRPESLLRRLLTHRPAIAANHALLLRDGNAFAVLASARAVPSAVIAMTDRVPRGGAVWAESSGVGGPGAMAGFAWSSAFARLGTPDADGPDLYACVVIPLDFIAPTLGNVASRTVLLQSLLALLLMAVGVALARRITEPVGELVGHARRVAAGDFASRVRARTRDELGGLSEAVNDMAARLETQRATLERQVAAERSQARRLELLSEVGRAAISAFDLRQVLLTLHAGLARHIAYDGLAAAVFRANGDASLEQVEGEVFVADATPDGVRLFLEELTLGAGTADAVALREGAMEDEPVLNRVYAWFCVVPLRVERGLLGAVVLARRDASPLTPDERQSIEGTAQLLALAVEHIRLYERTEGFARELERQVQQRTHELEKSHERLLATERHAATGRLAAGIAHEVNNPLGIIKNYLNLLRAQHGGETGPDAEAFAVIGEELDRIARIVRNLLDFYRPPRMPVGRVDVNEEIRTLAHLMQGGMRRHGIGIELRLGPGLPDALMPPDQFRQVTLNLLRNAEDAMRNGGGQLTVTTGLQPGGRADDPAHIVVDIADTGCGISPDDRQHIFEPFFTTKGEGQGTGLGLAVSYGIVRNAGGSIDVESSPGHGSVFTLRLRAETGARAGENPH